MSYGITAYLLDTEQLKLVLGSGNEEYAESFKNLFSEQIEILDERFEDDDDGLLMDDAITGLIHGKFEHNAKYAYALEIICMGIGSPLYPLHLTQLSLRWLHSFKELRELGNDEGSLHGLIPMAGDFPGIGCIDRDAIEEKITLATNAIKDTEDDNAQECYYEYISWLERAKEKHLALVTFLY